jgi:hypothetical protein
MGTESKRKLSAKEATRAAQQQEHKTVPEAGMSVQLWQQQQQQQQQQPPPAPSPTKLHLPPKMLN